MQTLKKTRVAFFVAAAWTALGSPARPAQPVDFSSFDPVPPLDRIVEEARWLSQSEDGVDEHCNIIIAARALTPKLVVNSGGPQSTVRALAFSPDGERLYTAGLDKVVQVWGLQVEDRAVRRTAANRAVLVQQLRWEIERGPNGQIYAVAASPVDRRLAVAGFGARVTPFGVGGDIVVYDTARGEIDRLLQGHSNPVIALEFSPSGKRLISAARNGEILLWDEAANWERKVIRAAGKDESVFIPLRFLTEDVVAAPVRDSLPNAWRVGLYNVGDPSKGPSILSQVHANGVVSIAVDARRKRFATSDMTSETKGNIYVWNGFENPSSTLVRSGRMATAMDFDPAGRLFASTALYVYADETKQSALEMWDVDAKKLVDQVEVSDRENTQACRVSPDGARVVTFAGHEGELRVYLLRDRDGNVVDKPLSARALRLRGSGRPIHKVAFADGPGYRIGYSNDPASSAPQAGFDFNAMAPVSGEAAAQAKWRDSETYQDWSADIVDHGQKVVLLKGGAVWATISFQSNVEGIARCVAFLAPPAGGAPYAVAVGTALQNGVFVYGVRGKDEPCPMLRHFRDHSGFVSSLSVSSDGKYLASGALDQTIKLWSLEGLSDAAGRFGPRPAWGASFVFEGGQVVVRDVLEAGTAARKGLRDGDVVVDARFVPPVMRQLNQDPTKATSDSKAVLEGLESTGLTDLVLLTLKRRGSVLNRQVLMMPAWDPVLTLFVDERGEWAAFTPKGYYDASVAGDELFGWQINRGQNRKPDFYRADQFRRQLERPAALRQLLVLGSIEEALRRADEPLPDDPVAQAARATPRITILSPTDAQVLEGETAPLVAKIEYPDEQAAARTKGRAYVNGVPGKEVADRRNANERTYEWSADVTDAYNRLRVVADDADAEPLAFADVHFRLGGGRAPRKPKLHVFAVAASKYQHVAPLEFPVKDAEAVVEVLRAKTGELYELGRVTQLYDDDVSREGVAKAVEEWRRQLADARSDDLLVVFLAGHGLAVDGQYYFVPVATRGEAEVVQSGVDWGTLRGLADVRCKKLFLLDTCHSGNVVPIRSAGAGQLKAAIRPLKQDEIIVMAATDVGQEAIEIGALGHGVFTQTLLDGLGGAADARKNGEVDLQEIAQYVEAEVPRRTRQYQEQTPKSFPTELINVISVPLVTLR